VREGDQLPARGRRIFKAGESLKAGSPGSFKFKLWEGDIRDPITDNRFIGLFEIRGADFDDGVIPAGAELVCSYEVLDSGNIVLEVEIPSIGGSFSSSRNFYSSQEGRVDYTSQARSIRSQSEATLSRLEEVGSVVDDPRIDEARARLRSAGAIDPAEADPETAKRAMDGIQEAKRLLSQARNDHIRDIRQMDLGKSVAFFNEAVRDHARPNEVSAFDNLVRTAQRAIDNNTSDFDAHLDDLRGRTATILWRQDWFVVEQFKWMAGSGYLFPDGREHARLVATGQEALKASDIDRLRQIVVLMNTQRIGTGGDDDIMAGVNIVQG
jgi:molecular chaperone DnaK